jgi:RNA polymerase sigma-70 factor (ECF subfamily)
MRARADPEVASRIAPVTSTDDARDQALLARVAARDREAFRQLYHLYHRRLARFLARLTVRHEIAEEIINDALWVVWRKAPEFRGDSRVSTWIMGITYRRGLKTLQRQHASVALLSCAHPAEELAGEAPVPQAERTEWVEWALAQLSVDQRMALELAYYIGHSYEEIAEIMSCPVNTVKTRMFHARQKMKTLLSQVDR